MYEDEVFSPEQDPIDTGESFVSTETDRQTLVDYKENGSLLGTKMMDDLRGDLLNELVQEVSTKKMAKKFAQLLDAEHVVKDEEGNVIVSKPDYRTQYKTLELLTNVRGDTAPKKNLNISGKINEFNFLNPGANPAKQLNPAKDIDEGAEYAAQVIEETSGG